MVARVCVWIRSTHCFGGVIPSAVQTQLLTLCLKLVLYLRRTQGGTRHWVTNLCVSSCLSQQSSSTRERVCFLEHPWEAILSPRSWAWGHKSLYLQHLYGQVLKDIINWPPQECNKQKRSQKTWNWNWRSGRRERPNASQSTFSECSESWVLWRKKNGYLKLSVWNRQNRVRTASSE